MKLIQEEGEGKLYLLNEPNNLYALKLSGSWYEMGKQYGIFAKGKIDRLNETLVASNKKLLPAETVADDFCWRVYNSASLRYRDLVKGVAEGLGMEILDVLAMDLSGAMGIYQGKLHAFAGCTSLTAWGSATTKGTMITGRNMDWAELFCEFPMFYTVFNPIEGNSFGSISWPGWLTPYTAINSKGVYYDLHDGTSMGGAVVSTDRMFVGALWLDALVECDTAKAVFHRFSTYKTDIPLIFMVADPTESFSLECPLWDCRRRLPDKGDDHLATANTFFIKDWGLHARDTVSHSMERFINTNARAKENYGKIDAQKMCDLFDLRLFNKDGTLIEEGGGWTKPENLDVDLTNYSFVCDIDAKKSYIKIPCGENPTEWIEVDNNTFFD